ncbi:hypothetical protein [Halopiger djelfimassiliensis]|uniref:hypothetical protein n=1 Tax=Halopiger djelfimassiliensis TaxID=1293047 RepID=UPI0012B592F0|nr:hypothetical protein [Halopiger djelfimassiliensis]
MGNDEGLTKDELNRLYYDYSPVSEFLREAVQKTQPHLLWFIFGIFLVQPVLLVSADQPLSELPVLGWHPGLAPLAVTTIGCSLLIYKFLLIQEHSLHSQPPFNTPEWISKQRIALLFLSVTFALTILIPLFHGMNIPEGKPASPFNDTFLQLSGLAVLLSYKYISKVLWDMLELTKNEFRAFGVMLLALAVVMISSLNFPMLSSVDLSLRQNAKMMVTSGLIIASLYVGVSRQLNSLRESYPEDTGSPQSRPLAILRESRLVSVGAGTIVGIGLPLAASVETARNAGVEYGDMLIIDHLITGYMSAVLGIVALVWFYLVLTVVIAALLGVTGILGRVTVRFHSRLQEFK